MSHAWRRWALLLALVFSGTALHAAPALAGEIISGADTPASEPLTLQPAPEAAALRNDSAVDPDLPTVFIYEQPVDKTVSSVSIDGFRAPAQCEGHPIYVDIVVREHAPGAGPGDSGEELSRSAFAAWGDDAPRELRWYLEEPVAFRKGWTYSITAENGGIAVDMGDDLRQRCEAAGLRILTYPRSRGGAGDAPACVPLEDDWLPPMAPGEQSLRPYAVWGNISIPFDPYRGPNHQMNQVINTCARNLKVTETSGNAWLVGLRTPSGVVVAQQFVVAKDSWVSAEQVRAVIMPPRCPGSSQNGRTITDAIVAISIESHYWPHLEQTSWGGNAVHQCMWSGLAKPEGTAIWEAFPRSLGWPTGADGGGVRDPDWPQTARVTIDASEPAPGTTDPREHWGGHNPGAPDAARCNDADPVNCANGNFFHEEQDLALPGRGVTLSVERTYNAQAAAAGVSGVFGLGWSSAFDARIESVGSDRIVHHGNGSTVGFRRVDGEYRAPRWVRSELQSRTDGGYRYELPDHTVMTFDADGRLVRQEDRNGNAITLVWSSGKIARVEGGGRAFTFTTGSNGLVTRIQDGTDRNVLYTYVAGRLTVATDVSGSETTYDYDGNGRMTSLVDPIGAELKNAYDAQNRVTVQTDPLGRQTKFVYARNGRRATTEVTDRNGVKTTHHFWNGLPTRMVRGTNDPQTTEFTYTKRAQIQRVTDPAGGKTHYAYDEDGNVTRVSDPGGGVARYVYNADDLVTRATTAAGRVTEYDYDSRGNVTEIRRTGPGGGSSTVRFTVGSYGQVLTETDVDAGLTTTYVYDTLGNRTEVREPGSRVSSYSYNVRGEVLMATPPAGNRPGANRFQHSTLFVYDEFGRVIVEFTPGSGGAVAQYTYDDVGRISAEIDPDGRVTTYQYDLLGRVLQRNRADGVIEKWQYRPEGEVSARIDGSGKQYSFYYDEHSRLTARTFPGQGGFLWRYDTEAREVEKFAPDGTTTLSVYDRRGRLRTLDSANDPDVRFTYDADGLLEQVTEISGGSDSLSLTWDGLGRLTARQGSDGRITRLQWNEADQLASVVYPEGRSYRGPPGSAPTTAAFGAVQYGYDAAGDLITARDWSNREFHFEYDANGALAKAIYPQGSATYTRDLAGRVTNITTPAGNRSYQYTPGGIPKQWAVGETTVPLQTDPALRLTQLGSQQFGFSAADHPTTLSEPSGAAVQQTFAAAGRQLTRTSGGATTNFTFDPFGRRTKETVGTTVSAQYGYDDADHLTSYTGPTHDGGQAQLAFGFGPDGARDFVERGGIRDLETWMPGIAGEELLLTRGTDAYVYGPDGMVLERVSEAGNATYQWQDAVGTVIGGSTAGGAVTTLNYDAWGRRTGGDASQVGVLGFAGQVTEPGTDLVYMRARSYDPKTAQFLTRDALEDQTGQPYLYAAGNPTLFVDPTGLAPNALQKFAGGVGRGASLGLWDGGSWHDPCSLWGFAGEQLGGALDPLRKVKVPGRALGVLGSSRATLAANRRDYVDEVRRINNIAKARVLHGADASAVARDVVEQRNALKRAIRANDPRIARSVAATRNLFKYRNAIGPTYEGLRKHRKSDIDIIMSAGRTNRSLNDRFSK